MGHGYLNSDGLDMVIQNPNPINDEQVMIIVFFICILLWLYYYPNLWLPTAIPVEKW